MTIEEEVIKLWKELNEENRKIIRKALTYFLEEEAKEDSSGQKKEISPDELLRRFREH